MAKVYDNEPNFEPMKPIKLQQPAVAFKVDFSDGTKTIVIPVQRVFNQNAKSAEVYMHLEGECEQQLVTLLNRIGGIDVLQRVYTIS